MKTKEELETEKRALLQQIDSIDQEIKCVGSKPELTSDGKTALEGFKKSQDRYSSNNFKH